MELKQVLTNLNQALANGLNRTFVELKLAPFADNFPAAPSLNRTFVELKHPISPIADDGTIVLIEPLWN